MGPKFTSRIEESNLAEILIKCIYIIYVSATGENETLMVGGTIKRMGRGEGG